DERDGRDQRDPCEYSDLGALRRPRLPRSMTVRNRATRLELGVKGPGLIRTRWDSCQKDRRTGPGPLGQAHGRWGWHCVALRNTVGSGGHGCGGGGGGGSWGQRGGRGEGTTWQRGAPAGKRGKSASGAEHQIGGARAGAVTA